MLSNQELISTIEENNEIMQRIINEDPTNINNNDYIKKVFDSNLNYYNIANSRGLKVPGLSFMRALSSVINHPIKNTILDERNLTKKR